jgi:UDP-GlcNAc3NAcA epimerase
MELLSVVGARPQFVKAAAVHRALMRKGADHAILHTGQHYDDAMSRIFFEELEIPRPAIDLGVGSGSHGRQTARMTEGIEAALMERRPDALILYGDTNSTLAGAIAAAKLHVPVAHVEAGLRSFNKAMPEEVNRILCDHCSTWLFCPTETAMRNLAREGILAHDGAAAVDRPKAVLTGDVMMDISLHYAAAALERSRILEEHSIASGHFLLATVHRDFNTDDPSRLKAIFGALETCASTHGFPVVLPVHPRTRASLDRNGLCPDTSLVRLIPPVGYLDMIALESSARLILTDSGGVQKEAYFFRKPCVVLRPETEWVELVEAGQARLVDADPTTIIHAVAELLRDGISERAGLYGDGQAADRIAGELF